MEEIGTEWQGDVDGKIWLLLPGTGEDIQDTGKKLQGGLQKYEELSRGKNFPRGGRTALTGGGKYAILNLLCSRSRLCRTQAIGWNSSVGRAADS